MLWLLLVATYGLVNANAKWQVKSDAAMSSIEVSQSASIQQLFTHMDKQAHVDLVVIKIVDDMLATGTDDALKCFIKSFDRVPPSAKLSMVLGECGFLVSI